MDNTIVMNSYDMWRKGELDAVGNKNKKIFPRA